MTEKKVSKRYARALYGLAVSSNILDNVWNDMTESRTVLNSSRDLRVFLKNPIIPTHKKVTVIKDLFTERVSKLTLDFFLLLVRKNREGYIPDITEQFEYLYNDFNKLKPVTITTAIEINDETKTKLLNEIQKTTDKKMLPSYQVNPKIKGGFIVRVDDDVLDFSVSHKLTQIYNSLTIGKN